MLLVLPLGVVNMAVQGIAPLYGRGDKASLQRILQGGTVLASLPSLFVGTMCLIAPQFMLLVILGPGYEGRPDFFRS